MTDEPKKMPRIVWEIYKQGRRSAKWRRRKEQQGANKQLRLEVKPKPEQDTKDQCQQHSTSTKLNPSISKPKT